MGRCGGCGHWNTLVESVIGGEAPVSPATPTAPSATHRAAVPLAELDDQSCEPLATGIDEFDRVLGGGLVPGSITLVGGEPGVGKSTLLTQVTAAWARRYGTALSISAEESPQQVSARFTRIAAADGAGDSGEPAGQGVHIGGDCNIDGVLGDIATLRPQLAVVDSIQTVFDPALSSAPGSVAQVRQCSHRLAVAARQFNCAIVLVGQVTKDGSLAGPRVLEHLVDTVLSFDGERELGLRVMRALKHRFGPTGELGVFEMTSTGLVTIDDPSGRMLVDRQVDVAGSAVAVTIEGRRAVVLEMQGLVVGTTAPNPRRSATGFDSKRLAMLLAVLDKQMGHGIGMSDVYLSVVGGLRVQEPGSDLAAAAAIVSSALEQALAPDVVAIGEIGLAGELRSAAGVERRVNEAARLGFKRAVVPASDAGIEASIPLVGASNVVEALTALGLETGVVARPVGQDRTAAFDDLLLDRAGYSPGPQWGHEPGFAMGDTAFDNGDRPPMRLVTENESPTADGW